jgi:phosphoribosylformylglycinamidine cyclo-ligase
MGEKESRYFKRGVSYSKSEIHEAIKGLDKGLFPNAFCKILPDLVAGDPDHCNIMHADTAGTKTSLAYVYWKETGDLSVWEGIVQDSIVMNLDDMACVGCLDDIVLSSTVGRNKHLIPKEVVTAIIRSSYDFIDRMRDFGVNLFHAGGETADVGDIVRTADVGYTAFSRMKREDLLLNRIRPGNMIVGLASDGKCSYEAEYNGGMGSNGLTSARHDVLSHVYADRYPESFDPNTDRDLIYSGSRTLTEEVETPYGKITLGKLILGPTRTYLPILTRWLPEHKAEVTGMIHCTGGAQTKVLKFLDEPVHVVKDNMFDIPPLFNIIREESGADLKEMYPVFNMGHRLEVYVDGPEAAQALISVCDELGVRAKIIGYVEGAQTSSVTIHGPEGDNYSYTE